MWLKEKAARMDWIPYSGNSASLISAHRETDDRQTDTQTHRYRHTHTHTKILNQKKIVCMNY